MCCNKCGKVLTDGEIKESWLIGVTPLCYGCIIFIFGVDYEKFFDVFTR